MFESLLKKHLGSLVRLGLASVSGGGMAAAFMTPALLDSVSEHIAAVAATAIISGGVSVMAAIKRNKKIQKLQNTLEAVEPGLADIIR